MSFSMCLECNDKSIGDVRYLDLYKKGKDFFILLNNVRFYHNSFKNELNEHVNIKRVNSELYLMSLNVIDNAFFHKGGDVVLRVSHDSWLNYKYAKTYSDILSSWLHDDTQDIDWKSLSKEKKKVWLDLCYDSREKNKVISDSPIIIEGKDILDIPSLYCCLGEAFFGKKGYIGCNLDSFDDYLIDIAHTGHTVIFNNMTLIDMTLNTEKSYSKYKRKYTDILLDILEKHKFNFRIS